MRKRSFEPLKGRGAVCAGLFFGLWLGAAGCVTPAAGPETTNTPVPTATGIVKPTPEPVTVTPVPVVTEPVVKPTVAPTAGPTEGPAVTPTITPAVSPTPTECPQATLTATPECTPTSLPQEGDITESPTLTPEITMEPLPEPTPTPVPLPTMIPEYETLLQSGWQRTEDFFGCREIFFSGMFDDAEPVVGEGSYEFCYRSGADVSVWLRIIGEEGLRVQMFLDELRQNRPECLIVQEGPDDYSYTYIDGEIKVSGRVYACGTGETSHRMRVEFYSPADSDSDTEGYGFYLR